MRQLMFRGPGKVEWVEVPEPELVEATDALVRPLAVAACDLDIAVISGRATIGCDYPLGHEFVAEVVDVGDEVAGWRSGARVIVPFQISCGTCVACAQGRTGNCRSVRRGSMYGAGDAGGREWGGAWADLVRVPFADDMLVALPDGITAEAAANISDNLTDAWRTVAPYLGASPGADVLVLGGGGASIGLWAAELATALGASAVDYIDDDAARLELATDVGVNAIAGPVERPPKRALVVDVTGSPVMLNAALAATAPDGTCVSAAIYWENPQLPLLEMYAKNVTFVTGRPHSRAQLPEVLELVRNKTIDPLRIATAARWDELPDALIDGPVKLVTTP